MNQPVSTAPPALAARRFSGDRGDTMLMATILIAFLMLAAWALISGAQQWGARRDIQGAAAAAARAGAQVTGEEVRAGSVIIDPGAAASRADAVLAAAGYSGAVDVSGLTVSVTATGGVDYAFPAPGFPGTVTASATATATRGVRGDEGG